jgi:4-amino-4-deoxy-L-arabinose transferase-like glycosyltransferase
MRNSNNSKLIISIFLFISIALLASLSLLKNVDKTKFHPDEPGWIASGYYYSNLLLNSNFEWQQWSKCPDVPGAFQCGFYNSNYNPHLGQWIIGIPLKAFAVKGEREFFDFYNFDKSLEENKKEGNLPSQPILSRARSISVAIGTLCCLLVFAIGYYSNNLWIGSIAAMLLIFNKLFVTLSTQAMTDISYNFFLLCAYLVSIFLLRQSKLRHLVLISFLYGGLIGLASSVKIIAVLVGGLYFFLVILYKKFVCDLKTKDAVKCLAAFSFSSLFIVYLINPYFWPSFKEISIRETIQEVANYSKERGGREMQKEKFRSEYPQLSNFSHVLEFPLMFVRIKQIGEEQVKGIKSAQWGENRLDTFKETFFRESSSFPKESYVLVLGIILLGSQLINSIYRKELSESALPLLYFGANFVFILLFMTVNFDRYYLPTVIASKLVVAAGIYEASKLIWFVLRRSTKLISVQRQ